MSDRLGKKLKSAGRLALKVGAVAGLGGLAYLGMKHHQSSKSPPPTSTTPDWLDKARAERKKAREAPPTTYLDTQGKAHKLPDWRDSKVDSEALRKERVKKTMAGWGFTDIKPYMP